MALGGQMHHDFGSELAEHGGDRRRVAYIAFDELEARVIGDRIERGQIARVGQLVVDAHAMRSLADNSASDRGADKSSASRDKNSLWLGWLTYPKAFELSRAFDAVRLLAGPPKFRNWPNCGRVRGTGRKAALLPMVNPGYRGTISRGTIQSVTPHLRSLRLAHERRRSTGQIERHLDCESV